MRPQNYTQLTQEQRYQITAHLSVGASQSEIAHKIGAHKSTISRELQRNCGMRGYHARQAQNLAITRARHRARPRVNPTTRRWVQDKLRQDWSPQQVAGCLRWMLETERSSLDPELRSVSHEWIYLWVYADKSDGGTLHRRLRCQKKRRKRYASGRSRRGRIPDRVCISERPTQVEKRERIGDWEGDTIIGRGHRQALVSLVERHSRYTLLHKATRDLLPGGNGTKQ